MSGPQDERVYEAPVQDAGAQARTRRYSRGVAVTKAGVSMGTALAIAISWSEYRSILWAIVHGFLSWLYVIYYALTR